MRVFKSALYWFHRQEEATVYWPRTIIKGPCMLSAKFILLESECFLIVAKKFVNKEFEDGKLPSPWFSFLSKVAWQHLKKIIHCLWLLALSKQIEQLTKRCNGVWVRGTLKVSCFPGTAIFFTNHKALVLGLENKAIFRLSHSYILSGKKWNIL